MARAFSLEEAREKKKAFETLPIVEKVDSLADFVPSDQQNRMEAISEIEPLVKSSQLDLTESDPPDPEEILDILERIQFKLRSDAEWSPEKRPEEEEIKQTRGALIQLIQKLKGSNPNEIKAKWTSFQQVLLMDFSEKLELLRNNVNPPGPIVEQDVPKALTKRFQGDSGDYLLKIFAKENVWERDHMSAFSQQLTGLEPDITGPPIVAFIAIGLMKQGYLEGAIYAFLAILIVVLFTFRDWKAALFALSPLFITAIWTLGFMGWTKLDFNLANLIALPLVLGIVVDDGIHVVHRFRENCSDIAPIVSGSTAQAITLTSWTTMVGFGSLLFAKHYGIFSLGLLITLSVGIAWILSLVFLPTALSQWGRRL
jgi:predicted RND superfamily exporter protein